MKKKIIVIVSLVLVLASLLTLSSMFSYAGEEVDLGEIDGIPIKLKCDTIANGIVVIPKSDDVDAISVRAAGDTNFLTTINEEISEHDVIVKADFCGVALLLISTYEKAADGSGYNPIDKYFAVVAIHEAFNTDMGEIKGLRISDWAVYTGDKTFLGDAPECDCDEGSYSCTYYVGENNCVILSENGVMEGIKPGVDNAVCYVIDANGTVFSDEFTISVSDDLY